MCVVVILKVGEHSHIIIENSTGDVVFHRDTDGNVTMMDNDKCPGVNESKKT